MTIPFHISEAAVRAKATEKSYDRGLDYQNSGMVERVTQRGNRLFPEAQGSEWDSYPGSVTFAAGDFHRILRLGRLLQARRHCVAALHLCDDSPAPMLLLPFRRLDMPPRCGRW